MVTLNVNQITKFHEQLQKPLNKQKITVLQINLGKFVTLLVIIVM